VSRATTKASEEDVTGRLQSEELLREAQRRTESILASVTDTHIVFDRQWHYAYVNDAAVRAISRPRDQIIGRTLWDVFPDIVGTELERQYRRAMEERVAVAFEFHYLALDSWWDNRFNPVPEGVAVFATDITERKRAEAERAQLAAIVRSSDDAIIAESLDGIVLSWNQGAARMYGYAAEEIVGCPISRLIPPIMLTSSPEFCKGWRAVNTSIATRRHVCGRMDSGSTSLSPSHPSEMRRDTLPALP
jgi:PAS domain S-box-containing protein